MILYLLAVAGGERYAFVTDHETGKLCVSFT